MKHIMFIFILMFVSCGSIPSADDLADAFGIDELSEAVDGEDNPLRDNDLDGDVDEEDDWGERVVEGVDITEPINPTFLGTFEKSYATTCGYYPSVLRMYTDGVKVYYQDQRGEWVIEATIFQDGTFDFAADVVNQWGNVVSEQLCTCVYYDGYYYGDYFQCTCEIDSTVYDTPGSSTCSLDYDQL